MSIHDDVRQKMEERDRKVVWGGFLIACATFVLSFGDIALAILIGALGAGVVHVIYTIEIDKLEHIRRRGGPM